MRGVVEIVSDIGPKAPLCPPPGGCRENHKYHTNARAFVKNPPAPPPPPGDPPPCLVYRAHRLRGVVEHAPRVDEVEGFTSERQRLRVSDANVGLEAEQGQALPGVLDGALREVDP